MGVLLGAVVRGWSERRRQVATWVGWLVGVAVGRVVVLVVWLVSALVGTLVGVAPWRVRRLVRGVGAFVGGAPRLTVRCAAGSRGGRQAGHVKPHVGGLRCVSVGSVQKRKGVLGKCGDESVLDGHGQHCLPSLLPSAGRSAAQDRRVVTGAVVRSIEEEVCGIAVLASADLCRDRVQTQENKLVVWLIRFPHSALRKAVPGAGMALSSGDTSASTQT